MGNTVEFTVVPLQQLEVRYLLLRNYMVLFFLTKGACYLLLELAQLGDSERTTFQDTSPKNSIFKKILHILLFTLLIYFML